MDKALKDKPLMGRKQLDSFQEAIKASFAQWPFPEEEAIEQKEQKGADFRSKYTSAAPLSDTRKRVEPTVIKESLAPDQIAALILEGEANAQQELQYAAEELLLRSIGNMISQARAQSGGKQLAYEDLADEMNGSVERLKESINREISKSFGVDIDAPPKDKSTNRRDMSTRNEYEQKQQKFDEAYKDAMAQIRTKLHVAWEQTVNPERSPTR